MLKNTIDQYGVVARFFHWIIFILVLGVITGGVVLEFLPDGSISAFVVGVHKSMGVVILVLMTARLLWRLFNPRPRDLGRTPYLNQLGRLMHMFLYILLFLQPLLGIFMSQAYGYPVSVFGWFELPTLIWESPRLGKVLNEMHGATAVILMICVTIHAAAALKHHFLDKNRTLLRMIKGR